MRKTARGFVYPTKNMLFLITQSYSFCTWRLQVVVIVIRSHQTRAGDRQLIVAPSSAESSSETAGVELSSCMVQRMMIVEATHTARVSSCLNDVRIVWVMRASRSLNADPGAEVSSVNLQIH